MIGMDVTLQEAIDKKMVETLDGTKNEWGWSKSKLGANAILAPRCIAQLLCGSSDSCVQAKCCHDLHVGSSVAKSRLTEQQQVNISATSYHFSILLSNSIPQLFSVVLPTK